MRARKARRAGLRISAKICVLIYENMPEYPMLCTGMNGILSVPLPWWEGLGEGENGKGFSPPPLSSPIKGEEIVFKEIGKLRPVGGVIHSFPK